MSLFIFLTVIQALVAAALVGVVLMQRSEGGGLGIGAGAAHTGDPDSEHPDEAPKEDTPGSRLLRAGSQDLCLAAEFHIDP